MKPTTRPSMKLFAVAILALAGSATASFTARPFGEYMYYMPGPVPGPVPGNVPTDIVVTFHGETLDAHIAACTGYAIDACTSKANFACFDKGFRMDDDKLFVDDLQNAGCLKDNMKRAGGELYSNYDYEMSYNATGDSVTVLLVGANNYTLVLQKYAGTTDNPSVIEGHCSGWKCIYDMGRGGCNRSVGFNVTMTMPGDAGHGQLTIPVGVIPWDDGAPQCQPGSAPGSCNVLVRGSWYFGNWSDVYKGNVVQPRPDGETDVTIIHHHQIPKDEFALSFSGQDGAHAGMMMNCSMAF